MSARLLLCFGEFPNIEFVFQFELVLDLELKVELMSHALFLNWDHTFIVSYGKTSRFRWKGSTAVVHEFSAWFVTWRRPVSLPRLALP